MSDKNSGGAKHAISPLDGRYAARIEGLSRLFSEFATFKSRLFVEIEWLVTIATAPEIAHVRPLTVAESRELRSWVKGFSDSDFAEIKKIEARTRHDTKAVEYYLRDRVATTSARDLAESIHFACTSEDVNNLAFGLMLTEAITSIWIPAAEGLVADVATVARATRNAPILSRTHGQAATPSTFGKELAVFVWRWKSLLDTIKQIRLPGKFGGATGTYSAHVVAYPDAPWRDIARRFVEGLGLVFNPLTTQIEPHDQLAALLHSIARFNTAAINFDRDCWTYISLGYLKQIAKTGEIGSSTMPHKVNPIDFENSEANFGISNSLLMHLASTLPISRLQRDLTDSSALRNVGVAIGHSLIGLTSARHAVERVQFDATGSARDLDNAWGVLSEAVQTLLRKHGQAAAYEKVESATKGVELSQADLHKLINSLPLPAGEIKTLLDLTPAKYIGLAPALVDLLDDPL